MRIINGKERSALTIRVRIWFNAGRGFIPVSGSLVQRRTPSGSPSTILKSVERTTIISVSPVA
jgi:hypothetical protein